jgi:hypothetical protein
MAHMNGGFEKHGFDEDAFGPKGGFSNLKTFDAFRKLAPTRCFAARFAIPFLIALCACKLAIPPKRMVMLEAPFC